MNGKFQAFFERIEFQGVSPYIQVFQRFDWFSVKFSRQFELKTIAPFMIILQRQVIPGERDIFQGFFPGCIWAVCQFFMATLNNQNFDPPPPVWLF